jgi:ribonuclease D
VDTSDTIKQPGLLGRLKEGRNIKAREMNVPHYVILHQKTLVALANLLPQSMRSLKMVKGMGLKKSEKFGEELLDIIISYCKKENIEPQVETIEEKKPSKKIKEDTKKISYALFVEGKLISQIAAERRLNVNTIEAHLAYYVGTGEIQINKLVSKEIADLIGSHFEGRDDLLMGPVKEILGDKVSWSEMRFVVNHLKYLRKAPHS